MTKFSQRDGRWANVKINNTKYTIGTDGCYITCLGMVVDTTPDVVASKIGFDGAQINYQGLDKIGLELVEKSNQYDNQKVLNYIADYGFCVVRVDWDGSPKSTGDTHFVLYIGNKRMIDPWTGNEVDTSKYPLVKGFRAFRRVSMSNDLEACMRDRERFWDERDELLRALGAGDVEGGKNVIGGMKSRITDLSNQLGSAKAEAENQKEKAGRIGDELLKVNNRVELLESQANSLTLDLDRMAKEKGLQAIELAQAKEQIVTLKEQVAEGSVTLSIKDLFTLLWNHQIIIKK